MITKAERRNRHNRSSDTGRRRTLRSVHRTFIGGDFLSCYPVIREVPMRILIALLLFSTFMVGQENSNSNSAPVLSTAARSEHDTTTPAGTKLPITLKNTISTKGNH